VINTGGMPGWQVILIAIGAALLGATAAVLLDRARATRRNAVTAATPPVSPAAWRLAGL
jgi:hypothetical protein